MKRCSRCQEQKPLTEFHRDRSRRDGLARRCKSCVAIVYRQWRDKDPERARAEWRSAYERYAPKVRFRKYELSPNDLLQLRATQRNRCAICGKHESEVRGRHPGVLSIDHIEGEPIKVRGLLCYACNIGLGLFDHNPDVLRRAAEYLENPPGDLVLGNDEVPPFELGA